MSEHGDRAGAGPEGPGRRRPPSRRMRERADEMADLLAHAAPAVRARRSRRSAAIPAAVVALGALTVGGVGVALGLDAEPAGAVALPGGPPVAADPGGQPIGPAEESPRNTSAVADVPVDPDDDQDETSTADEDGRPDLARPPVAAPRRPAVVPARPARPSTDTEDDGGDGGDGSHASRTTTSTTSRTPSSRPRPTSTRGADDEPTGSTTRSGRSTTPRSAGLSTDGLDGRSVVPEESPTVDGE